ncbi:MAG: aldehyde dehydrogenase family protein [Bacteroidetes bacterium]|nr:aldehyde dehydrogenase family protein [Bacteroidota bacterium]
MQAEQTDFKFTYSTMGQGDSDAFHGDFDAGVEEARQKAGATYPNFIADEAREANSYNDDISPTDRNLILGYFANGTADDTRDAIQAAKSAYRTWSEDWHERVRILRAAADLISERKYFFAAVMCLEVGKSRLEAMGDTEEAADLIRYYCQQMEDANGFFKRMGQLSPDEHVVSVLRPFGVWAVIAPFNFPLALSAGMSAGALVAGNTVVYKPSSDAPWTGVLLYDVFREAGLPAGVFNYVNGPGSVVGEELVTNPDVDGIVFTGSKEVGMSAYHRFSPEYPKPCVTEMGGKNPAIVTANADAELAAEGVMRSVVGLSGQKCSACSRVYVHPSLEGEFLDRLVEKTRAVVIGDPSERGVFLGPLVNESAYQTYQGAVEVARRDGTILSGGNTLSDPPFDRGYFVEPTIVTGLPMDHELFYKELFVPFVTVGVVETLEEAVDLSNRSEYGLTAGVYSSDPDEVEWFFNHIESGVCYANRRSGATTGAWPGVQAFCGWKGSGSTGKGGCGPYYVQQFMREQSRTIVEASI